MEENLTSELNLAIRAIEDYPKPGIVFRDISTLLQNARAFRRAGPVAVRNREIDLSQALFRPDSA